MSTLGKRPLGSPIQEARQTVPTPEAADETTARTAKSAKLTSEIDELALIPPEQAWIIDTSALFPEKENRGIRVICVVQNLRIHYDILVSLLPTYVGCCALVQNVDSSLLGDGEHPIPLKPGLGHNYNHFLKLGVLHPLGGAQSALDSIIIIDAHDRRRLVVPFGWGAGRHVLDAAGGAIVQQRLMEVFLQSMGQLLEVQ